MKGPDVKPEYLNGLRHFWPFWPKSLLHGKHPKRTGSKLTCLCIPNAEQDSWYKMGVNTTDMSKWILDFKEIPLW